MLLPHERIDGKHQHRTTTIPRLRPVTPWWPQPTSAQAVEQDSVTQIITKQVWTSLHTSKKALSCSNSSGKYQSVYKTLHAIMCNALKHTPHNYMCNTELRQDIRQWFNLVYAWPCVTRHDQTVLAFAAHRHMSACCKLCKIRSNKKFAEVITYFVLFSSCWYGWKFAVKCFKHDTRVFECKLDILQC